MKATPPQLDLHVGPQGLTWRQRAKIAQLRAEPAHAAAPTHEPSDGLAQDLATNSPCEQPDSHLRLVGHPPDADRRPAVPDLRASRAARRNAAATRHATPAAPSADDATDAPRLAASDPRWVLALRAAHALDHTAIVPEQRDRLVRLGRSLGLSPFDVNLIVAIVQDQARRGTLPDYCASAGHDQLAMIPPPRRATWLDWLRPPRLLNTVVAVVSLLGLQALLVWWIAVG